MVGHTNESWQAAAVASTLGRSSCAAKSNKRYGSVVLAFLRLVLVFCLCIYIYIYIYLYVYIHKNGEYNYKEMQICVHIYMHIHTLNHACMYLYVSIYSYRYRLYRRIRGPTLHLQGAQLAEGAGSFSNSGVTSP